MLMAEGHGEKTNWYLSQYACRLILFLDMNGVGACGIKFENGLVDFPWYQVCERIG